jgi:hypothetical protein
LILLLDRAGWHTTSKLDVPENITPIFPPSRAPALNRGRECLAASAPELALNTVFETMTPSSTPHAPLGGN